MRIIYFFIIIGILSACGSKQAPAEQANESGIENIVKLNDAQLQMAKIAIGNFKNIPLSHTIKVNGIIDVPPQNLVSVSVPFGGYLKSTKLLPGMHLKKGEVIAVLEDQQYIQLQQDYLTCKTRLEMLEAEFNRQKDLNDSKASSDKLFQAAKSEYYTQKINLKAIGEKLKLININPINLSEQNLSKQVNLYAPFNGFVSKVNANLGKYIAPADVLFELVDPSDIHLNLKVFEKDITQLAIGQRMLAYTNSNPDKKYKCEIILISKDISDDRTAEVHCHFDVFDKNLLPGMYMNAEVELKNKESLCVPEQSVVQYQGKSYIFIAKDKSTFEMTEIQTGLKENGWIEVLQSEKMKDERIASEGAYNLLMSLKNKSED
ncbi:MAG: efflux RND transporter periplasmic adaptor subunit [Saprospiraceae bacterium]